MLFCLTDLQTISFIECKDNISFVFDYGSVQSILLLILLFQITFISQQKELGVQILPLTQYQEQGQPLTLAAVTQ